MSVDGAVFDVGRSEFWRVGGGRKTGSKAGARYNNGADAEAVTALDGRWGRDLLVRDLRDGTNRADWRSGETNGWAFWKSGNTRNVFCRERRWLC